jgi:hypothetical protein
MKALVIVAAASVAVLAAPCVFAQGRQADNADAIRDRLDKYLIAYEPQLSSLVAEERMSQRDAPGRGAVVTAAPDTKHRSMVSEVAFIGLPGDAGWLGFRRVVQVNGRTVSDAGPPLAVLLTDGASDDYDQARLLLTESARHNLGSPRTTNLPNLPLEFLHPRNRHRLHHRIDATEKIRGSETTVLVLQEHSSPTIIQRPEGGDMQSLVRAWVETTTGRLIRAEVRTRDARLGVLAAFDNVIRVDFRPDQKLEMLVPYEMDEVYFAGRFRDGTGTARYSNYRQFRTAARIVPPKGP